jgi:hypothetical protein
VLSEDTKRPNYYDGEYLTPADFVAEQAYHADLRRRIALGQHTWGIFAGLELQEQPHEGSADTVDVYITPGLAVDGFGRELIAYAPQKLDVALFLNPTLEAGWVPVWIRYLTELTDPPRYGYEICDDPNFAYRTRETFRIEVGTRQLWHDKVTVAGKEAPDDELPVDLSVPHQGLPDDTEDKRWRVKLGYVNWDGTGAFVKSTTDADADQRVKERVYGGVVAAHTYPPGDRWELASRGRDQGELIPRVSGTVRGSLTVEDVTVALGKGLELHDSAVTFLDAKGEDRGRPLALTRADHVDGADLRIQIGKGDKKENRLVISGQKPSRVVVTDDGSAALAGGLSVKGITDVSGDDGDRILLAGEADDDLATAIGTEGGGGILYARAETGIRCYVGATPDGGASARVLIASNRLSVRGDAVVGAGGDGMVKTRHVVGKESGSDGDDDLYLNWSSGRNVHVGGAQRASLGISGDVTAGAGGDAQVLTRHVVGKASGNDAVDDLYLNWSTGRAVHVGGAAAADLFVSGGLFLGSTKIPVDVVVGRFTLSGFSFVVTPQYAMVPVATRLPSASQAFFMPALADGAVRSVRWTNFSSRVGNVWSFQIEYELDSFLFGSVDIAWTAVFVP